MSTTTPFYKRLIGATRLVFSSTSQIETVSRFGQVDGLSVRMKSATKFRVAHYLEIRDTITKANVAITTGVGVASSVNLLALAALATGGTTTFLNPASRGAGYMDVARTVQLAASAGVGDGTLSGASAKGVIVTGLNANGNTISELVPLNGTSVVNTIKAFDAITSIVPALNFVGGTDQVGCGYGLSFALKRPVASSNDLLEYGIKASASTAYTITTLPTTDVGEAYSTTSVDYGATDTSIVLASGGGANFPNGSQRTMAEIIRADGTYEEVIITNRSTDTLTVVRGANNTTAIKFGKGAVVCWRPGMTMTPASITANDRYYMAYRTKVL